MVPTVDPASAEAETPEQRSVGIYKALPAAALDVLAERQRQIEVEGWTPEHDDEHASGELANAAACYALTADQYLWSRLGEQLWPWDRRWWKPGDRRRDLVKAGALILAEIERLDRASLPHEQTRGEG